MAVMQSLDTGNGRAYRDSVCASVGTKAAVHAAAGSPGALVAGALCAAVSEGETLTAAAAAAGAGADVDSADRCCCTNGAAAP